MTNATFRTKLLTASLGLTLAASVFIASSADARTYKTFKVGAWNGTVQVSKDTGEFTHCTSSAKYRSGIELIFSISRNQVWGVGFSKKSWDLKKGKSYNVRYQVDRRTIRPGKAVAMTSTMAMIRLPDSSKLFKEMRRGRILKVATGDDLLKFSLKSTNRMLKSLLKCSVAHQDVVASVKNNNSGSDPFGEAKSRAVTTEQEGHKARWMKETRNRANALIDELNVDVSFMSPNDSPDIFERYDTVWNMGKYIGTLRVFPFANSDKINEVWVKTERKRCDGKFETRSRPTEVEGVRVEQASAICRKPDGTQWSAFYATYPRDRNSTYMLTAFTTKASLADTLIIGEHITKIAARQALEGSADAGSGTVNF